MKTRRIIPVFFLLLLLLSACGKRLDPETAALMDSCDAVCMGRVMETRTVPAPEGMDLDCIETADGTRWVKLLRIRLTADFFGNLAPMRTIFVLADRNWYLWSEPVPSNGRASRILFLDLVPGNTHWSSVWSVVGDCPVFVPHGEDGMRWETTDAEGIQLKEALHAYGRANPRELIKHAAQ